jgi:phosphatidylglycerol lysyltransferase
LFAFKHVEYSDELWWQFELSAEAPRFLRATVGSAIAVLLIAAAKLLRPAAHESIHRRRAISMTLPRSLPRNRTPPRT